MVWEGGRVVKRQGAAEYGPQLWQTALEP